ncbi:unnamed protein product [Porites evermanni]|uniref:Uncharacterized protein n=1 Tax=Porites evermanni TaxID=104178 RepID=A0ABN8SK88_9CNID|nr:unnamed protein product [Porites evermanni]
MAQNQPPLHYPAMLNPYPIYQNPVPGTSNHLQFEPDRDSASPTPSESSNRSDDRNKRSSWSLTEERCLIAAFKEFVKETKAHRQDCSSDDTDDILSTGNQDCSKKPEKRPPSSAGGDSADAETTGKTGQKDEKGPKKKKKRLSGDDMELAILDMMKSQQEAIQRSEENDERVFEALLKSQAEAQRQHQEFVVSVLGKLGDIFASKK